MFLLLLNHSAQKHSMIKKNFSIPMKTTKPRLLEQNNKLRLLSAEYYFLHKAPPYSPAHTLRFKIILFSTRCFILWNFILMSMKCSTLLEEKLWSQ